MQGLEAHFTSPPLHLLALYKSLARLQGHDLQLRSLVAHALYGTEARISAA